jgi:hypothetical protein
MSDCFAFLPAWKINNASEEKKEILIKLDTVGSLISFADFINRLLLKVAIL